MTNGARLRRVARKGLELWLQETGREAEAVDSLIEIFEAGMLWEMAYNRAKNEKELVRKFKRMIQEAGE